MTFIRACQSPSSQVLDHSGREMPGAVTAVMLENIDLAGAWHGPADRLVRFLHRRFVVAGAEQPPGWKHTGLAFAMQSQARRPFPAGEFLAILGNNAGGHVACIRVLVALFIQVVARPIRADIDDSKLEGPVADLAGVVLVVRNVTLVFVVDPEHLVLPVVRIEGLEIVEEIRFPTRRVSPGGGGQQGCGSQDRRAVAEYRRAGEPAQAVGARAVVARRTTCLPVPRHFAHARFLTVYFAG
jgi:hypothetical protein